MCDWDEAEYEEYLLWVESARARARTQPAPPSRNEARRERLPVYQPLVPAEA
jgi:hypothetical protein